MLTDTLSRYQPPNVGKPVRPAQDLRELSVPPADKIRELRSLRILVADDELLISELLCEILVSLECTVIGPARTLDHALRAIRGNDIDGALLDFNLGDASVHPAIDDLAQRGIPFILVTGEANLRREGSVRNAPILTKPFTIKQLRDAMCSAFRCGD